jgi:lambda repressor-like predicted transcriptional regulator
MKKAYSRDELVALMKKRQGGRSDRAFAVELGTSNQTVSNIYQKGFDIASEVADRLGFERRVIYIPKSAESEKQA